MAVLTAESEMLPIREKETILQGYPSLWNEHECENYQILVFPPSHPDLSTLSLTAYESVMSCSRGGAIGVGRFSGTLRDMYFTRTYSLFEPIGIRTTEHPLSTCTAHFPSDKTGGLPEWKSEDRGTASKLVGVDPADEAPNIATRRWLVLLGLGPCIVSFHLNYLIRWSPSAPFFAVFCFFFFFFFCLFSFFFLSSCPFQLLVTLARLNPPRILNPLCDAPTSFSFSSFSFNHPPCRHLLVF